MMVPEQIGRYRLGDKLGAGASGAVYRAEDTLIGRTVALKLIHVEDAAPGGSTRTKLATVDHFQREAQATGRLHHAHIVTLYDAGQEKGFCYLAMEFVEGETLAQALAREGSLALERALRMGVEVADALDFAHAQGVVHRDIKPSNLMLLPNGAVKVADFGIARLSSSALNGATVAPAGMMIGTPSYMSPEQVRAEPVDGRSDLFSLGVVLYQATTGERPFTGDNMAATLNAILNREPTAAHELNPALPRQLSEVLARVMAKDREARYPSGAQLAAELRLLLRHDDGGTVLAPRSSGVDVTRALLRRPAPAPAAAEVPAEPLDLPASQSDGGASRTGRTALLGGSLVAAAVAGVVGAYSFGLFSVAETKRSYIVATSAPTGAEIVLDGKLIGRTPYTFEIEPGSYEIEYRKPGYLPTQATIRVQDDQRVPVDVELVPHEEDK